MRLLVLGGLGAYPERLHTFVEQGHSLCYAATHGWPSAQRHLAGIPSFNLSAPDGGPAEPIDRLRRLIETERIEAVYSLLNVWDGSNRATAALLRRACPVPVIRHYKEHYLSPYDDERTCLEQSAGAIFINEESRDYFAGVYHLPARTLCLDGDLLPRRYLQGALQPKLSARDGRPHLLIAGSATDDGSRYDYRDLMRELAALGAHVHLYGVFRRLRPSDGWLVENPEVEAGYRALAAASSLLHVHAPIAPDRFVAEWSRFDAGLLHAPDPADRFRTLNFPNRYTAYLAAGLPVALADGAMPAVQRHLEALGAALVYRDPANLVRRLPNPLASAGALASRDSITFEAAFPGLLSFIQSCLPR